MLKESKKRTDDDDIISYYTGELDVLPAEIDRRRKRIEYILNNLLEHRPEPMIVELVKKVFGVKKSQVYMDIQSAKYIHGSFYNINKGFEVYKQLQAAESAIRSAQEKNDAAAIVRAIEAKTKILALVPDKKDDIDFEKMGIRNYYMVINMPGQTLELSDKNLIKMPQENRQKLLEQILPNDIDATYEILKEDAKGE